MPKLKILQVGDIFEAFWKCQIHSNPFKSVLDSRHVPVLAYDMQWDNLKVDPRDSEIKIESMIFG